MNDGFRRLLVLLAVFCFAFFVVFVVRKIQGGDSLMDILPSSASENGFESHQHTLRNKPSMNLKDVEVLAAINAESAALVRAVVPSVVSIDTTGIRRERIRDLYGRTWVQPRAVQGQGSGVIVTEEGHVLTNHHVIQGTPRIRLTMHDGSIHSARVIGTDPAVDIAVLKIDSKGPFIPLKFGESSKIEVGNTVFAIGSPFGLGTSVTEGKISAKKRPFSDSQVDLLQTSAAINPGNSGGPLINILGEIVGINSRIYSTNRDSPSFQGIGFAIPSNAAFKTMKDILDRGRPVRGFLGMAMEDLDPMTRKEFGYNERAGARVTAIVPNSPAMQAGLKKDDIVIRYQGKKIPSMRRLIFLIQQSKVGADVAIDIWRAGVKHNLTATIGEMEDFNNETSETEEDKVQKRLNTQAVLRAIGIVVSNSTKLDSSTRRYGVVITRVNPDSNLRGKLLMGDIIHAINGVRVTTAEDFLTRLAASASVQNTELIIQRGKSTLHITISPVREE